MEIQTVEFHRAAYKPEDFPRDDRPQFAFVGRSNVGKSSLINSILRRKGIARVSQTPGKTQAVQFYLINGKIYLVDLPGYGYAKVPRAITASWGALVRSYLESAETLRKLFLLIDCRRIPGDQDLDMKDWMDAAGVEWRTVMTKTDKLSNSQFLVARKEISEALSTDPSSLIRFSSVTRAGVADIWKDINSQLTGR